MQTLYGAEMPLCGGQDAIWPPMVNSAHAAQWRRHRTQAKGREQQHEAKMQKVGVIYASSVKLGGGA